MLNGGPNSYGDPRLGYPGGPGGDPRYGAGPGTGMLGSYSGGGAPPLGSGGLGPGPAAPSWMAGPSTPSHLGGGPPMQGYGSPVVAVRAHQPQQAVSFGGPAGTVGGPPVPPSPGMQKVIRRGDSNVAQVVGSLPTRSMTIKALNYKQPTQSNEASAVDADVSREAKNIFHRITLGENDTMSRLQLIRALIEDRTVCAFVLPGIDGLRLMDDDESYEAAHHLFNDLSKGRQRIRFQEFLANFRNSKVRHSNAKELKAIFERLDANRDNQISRHELLMCVKADKAVCEFFLKESRDNDLDEEEMSQQVDEVYKSICGSAKNFDFADFVAYFRSIARVEGCGLHTPIDRRQKRVLIIGPGFGAQMNPAQTQVVMQAGFQVHWVHHIPNPEEAEFQMLPHVSAIREAIDQVRPDLIMSGSKGGAYTVALWQMGYWRGPTVLINAHPSCTELPADVPIIITHGDQDPVYPRPRAELEALVSTGSTNMCFLYYSSTSGTLQSGHTPRVGDAHNMASLINFETLPRLMESVLCPEGPELHMMRTWLDRLAPPRMEAERMLGYTSQKLRSFWVSPQRQHGKTLDPEDLLFDVPANSLEFRWVSNAFRTPARDASTYGTVARDRWARMHLVRIQRIENQEQEEAGNLPYFNSVKNSCEGMGIEFVPGVHTRWLFHGSSAIDSIVSNPIQGFQPLASGSQGEAVWGRGTYFARDAEYVAAGPFCGMPAADGTRRMLMCLVTTGMSCAGDPAHHGILPLRRKPHRYNSSVDSVSSPEIFIVQHPGAAYPAYAITFAC